MAATGWQGGRAGQASPLGAPGDPSGLCAASQTPHTVAFARRTLVWLPKCLQRQTRVAAERSQDVAGSEGGGSRDPGSGSGAHWGMSVFRGCWPSL